MIPKPSVSASPAGAKPAPKPPSSAAAKQDAGPGHRPGLRADEPPSAPGPGRAEFEAALRGLAQDHEHRTDNRACVACTGCERCDGCTFCKASRALVRCHYCVDAQRLTDCTHCRACHDLLRCNHCVASERCAESSYLVKCTDCTGCTYCFGCVGLSGKDFHVLNQPYDRSTYFAVTARLARDLGIG